MYQRSLWVLTPLAFLVTLSLFPTTRADFANKCSSSDKTLWLSLDNHDIHLDKMSTVHSWGALINVAKSTAGNAANQLILSPSTVLNATIVMDADICKGTDNLGKMSPEQCRSRRGNLIDRSQLDYSTDVSSLGDNNGWATFQDQPLQSAAPAALSLTDTTVNMAVGIITESKNSNQHQLGLASGSRIIKTLNESNLINSRTWGLNSGSTSSEPRPGSLVIGGYDGSSLLTPPVAFHMDDYPVILGGRLCMLQVKVNRMVLQITTESGPLPAVNLSVPSTASNWCIEPNDHLPRFPSITRKNLLEALKDVNVANVSASDTIKDKSELYILEPGLAFPSSLNKFKLSLELTFNVDNNPDHAFVVHIPDNELKRPVSGLAKDGSFTEDPDYTELSIYSQPDVVDAASFGRSFLSQVYLFVDQDKRVFYLALQNMDARIPQPLAWTCNAPAEPTKPDMKDRQLYNSVFIALMFGSVVGYLFLLAVLIVLVLVIFKRCGTSGSRAFMDFS